MAANKYLALVAGKLKEVFGQQTSAGVGDANKLVALDSTGKIDATLMPPGVAAEVVIATATEALSAGDFVNIYDSAGTLSMRKADATTNSKPAHGFVLAAVSNAATGTVYLPSQTNNSKSGLTLGVDYWLSTTPGAITTTAPSAAGNIVQFIGRSLSATAIVFIDSETVEVA